MSFRQICLFTLGIITSICASSQFTQQVLYKGSSSDSTLSHLITVPPKYFQHVDFKIKKYTECVSFKTEKTLEKLSRWENKIKSILQKANPKAAERLFDNEQATFGFLLKKIKDGRTIAENYTARYDKYRDELTTSMKYLAQHQTFDSSLSQSSKAIQQLKNLSQKENENEYIQEFIKDRRKQLINEAVQYIGKSKYLVKINKESYYYFETLKNYKEVFSDSKKTEQAVLAILNKMPVFQKFTQQNSQLAGLFASPASFSALPAAGSMPVINGLAPRASVQQFIGSGMYTDKSFNATEHIQQQVNNLSMGTKKEKNEKKEIYDFTPNSQRTKPFFKRLEAGTDFQFEKSSAYIPSNANIGLKLGYRLNDKSSVGVGMSYMMGLGKGWNHIRLSNQGVGFRTYLGWKLKKGFGIQGGSEWNYMLQFKDFDDLKNVKAWQHSALLGLNKTYSISKKIKGNIQLLYNVLYSKNQPRTQPVVIRFGYGF